MGLMTHHQGCLLRANNEKKAIEYSTNDGRTWNKKGTISNTFGEAIDLTDNGKEILMTTTKGMYYSTTKGQTWNKR